MSVFPIKKIKKQKQNKVREDIQQNHILTKIKFSFKKPNS